jgi:hypothetical protein
MKDLIVVWINRTTKGGETKGGKQQGYKTKDADAKSRAEDVVPTKCGNLPAGFAGIAADQRFDT